MFQFLFRSYKITKFSRESYIYSEDCGRKAEIVVYVDPDSQPRFWIDDVALVAWLEPAEEKMSENDRAQIITRMRKLLGASVGLESSRGAIADR